MPWKVLTDAGHRVVFATESGGEAPVCDPLLITGVLFGQLGAVPAVIALYREMEQDPAFNAPIPWATIEPDAFDALVLPGGHAPGRHQYLGSELLQARVAAFWRTGKPVGAICHGVLLLARARDPDSGRSLLHGVRTTCLPAYMERLAYFLTFWRRGRYDRTYPAYVEAEVRAALADPAAGFERGPTTLGARGTADDDGPAFIVEDGRYVSACWPGDAYLFARKLLERLADDRPSDRNQSSGLLQKGHGAWPWP